jgi:hypothetical protein
MNCKKCGIGYGCGGCNGMISYGAVLLCNDCQKMWDIYYANWKAKKFPNGVEFYWINWLEREERDALFKEWIKKDRGFRFR